MEEWRFEGRKGEMTEKSIGRNERIWKRVRNTERESNACEEVQEQPMKRERKAEM